MSGFFDLLLAPYFLLTGVMSRSPWISLAVAAALSVLLMVTHHEAYAAGFVMVGAMLLMWLDEQINPRAIDQGVVAGD